MTSHFVGYKGPALLKATVDQDDVTATLLLLYGAGRNWQGRLWTMEDAFDAQHVCKELLIEWQRVDGRKDYSRFLLSDRDAIINPPINMPFCECGSPATKPCAAINPACLCSIIKGGRCSLPCGRIHESA
jgi:hypothetical protein